MSKEKPKLDKKLLAAVILLVLSALLALSGSFTAKTLLYQGVQTEEVWITGLDGAKLRAVIYKPSNAQGKLPAVIVVHGLGASSDTMNAISTELARNGILVLSLNYRGHDGSEGGVNYIGDPIAAPNISNDLFASLTYLQGRADVDKQHIGVIGYSMGSRAALRLGILAPNINPVVMIGPYYAWEISTVNTTRPNNLLIIVGENDIITPPSFAELLFNYATSSSGKPSEVFGSPSAGTGRKLVIVPGADHYTIVFTKKAIEETVEWVLLCFGKGKASYYLDPSVLGSLSGSASFLSIIAVLCVAYLVTRYYRSKGKIVQVESKLSIRRTFAIVLIIVLSILYILASFYTFPLIVDWGWRVYQFARFSGAQYTIFYFLFLALALLPIIIVLVAIKREILGDAVQKLKKNWIPGLVTVLIAWLTVYIMYNISLTGVVANYAMTPTRFVLMFYLFALCLPPIFVDEFYLRELIQDKIPVKKWWLQLGITIILEYMLRVLPFAWWVGLATQPLVAEGILKQYVAAGLISLENLDTVKSFLGMNAYGLYYAFMSVEMLHAAVASYLYKEYRNIGITSIFRALTVAFTMAAVMALL